MAALRRCHVTASSSFVLSIRVAGDWHVPQMHYIGESDYYEQFFTDGPRACRAAGEVMFGQLSFDPKGFRYGRKPDSSTTYNDVRYCRRSFFSFSVKASLKCPL